MTTHHSIRSAAHRLGALFRRRRARRQAILWASALLLTTGTGVVGALVSTDTTVFDNRFAFTQKVDTTWGTHEVAATPDNASHFGPAADGSITWSGAPNGTYTPIALKPGEAFEHTVTLPRGLTPKPLSNTEEPGRRIEWTQEASSEGTTIVTRKETIKPGATGATLHDETLEIPVTAATGITSDSLVSIELTMLPRRITSTSPTGAATIPSKFSTPWGAHDVRALPETGSVFYPGTPGLITWRGAPPSVFDWVRLARGEGFTHTITVPSGMTVGPLKDSTTTTRQITWSRNTTPTGETLVTYTETRLDNVGSLHDDAIQLPVTATGDLADRATISVELTGFPPRLTSSHPLSSGSVSASHDTEWGTHETAATPAEGNVFVKGRRGTIEWTGASSPAVGAIGVNSGDGFQHVVEVPAELTVGSLTDEKTATRTVAWTKSVNQNGSTRVTRTETRLNDGTTLGAERFSFPVQVPTNVSPKWGPEVTVNVTRLPAGWVSRHASETVKVPLPKDTVWGVHNLKSIPDGGGTIFPPHKTGKITWTGAPSEAYEPAPLKQGQRFVHRVLVPWGVTVGRLVDQNTATRTVTWKTYENNIYDTIVERTETRKDDSGSLHDEVFEIPVTRELEVTGRPVIFADLLETPEEYVSSSTRQTMWFPAEQEDTLEVGHVEVRPDAGDDFAASTPPSRSTGKLTWSNELKSGATPARTEAGESVGHTIELPEGLTPILPSTTDSQVSRVTWASVCNTNGSTTVTRSETFHRAQAIHLADVIELPLDVSSRLREGSVVAVEVTTAPPGISSRHVKATATVPVRSRLR